MHSYFREHVGQLCCTWRSTSVNKLPLPLTGVPALSVYSIWRPCFSAVMTLHFLSSRRAWLTRLRSAFVLLVSSVTFFGPSCSSLMMFMRSSFAKISRQSAWSQGVLVSLPLVFLLFFSATMCEEKFTHLYKALPNLAGLSRREARFSHR